MDPFKLSLKLEEVIAQSYPCHCGTWGWDGHNLLVIIQGVFKALPPETRTFGIKYFDPEGHNIDKVVYEVPKTGWDLGPLEPISGAGDDAPDHRPGSTLEEMGF